MSSIIQIARNKAQSIISNVNKSALHALAPDDFELYACSFELLKSNGDVERIFHFPVMPNGINIDSSSIVNIMKTGSGNVVQFNDIFVSKMITINGTFGRKFRLLVSNNSGNEKQSLKDIDLKVKTGYGAMKMLEYICDDLYKLDEFNSPRYLIFHNLAFNQSFLVEVISKSFSQSNENNVMWNYTLQLKAIADAKNINIGSNKKQSLKNLLTMGAIQFNINKIFSEINIGSISKLIKG
jgi:hypothetical protein